MIIIYGANWCPDCKRSKDFLDSYQVKYEYIDIEKSPEAIAKIEQINNGLRRIPTIIFEDGSILVEPSNKELAEKLSLQA